jgi:hypothetical protein
MPTDADYLPTFIPPPGPGSRHDPGEGSKDEVGIGKGGLEEDQGGKGPTRDEEAAPAAQVSFFFLFRETISPLRHGTTIRELSNLFIPPVFLFSSSLIRSALIKLI